MIQLNIAMIKLGSKSLIYMRMEGGGSRGCASY